MGPFSKVPVTAGASIHGTDARAASCHAATEATEGTQTAGDKGRYAPPGGNLIADQCVELSMRSSSHTGSSDRSVVFRPRFGSALAVLLLVLGASGCGGSSYNSPARQNKAGPVSAVPKPAENAAAAGTGASSSAYAGSGAPAPGQPGLAPNQQEIERKLIRKGSLSVRNKDVDTATAKAREIIKEQGGVVHGMNESGEGSSRTTRLVIKVAPEKFDDTMAKLRQTGEVVSSESGQQDVTEQLVDLEARLKAAVASRDRVLELTKRAGTVTELVALERELNARNQEVESLTARLKALNSQVAESTINLNIGATASAARPTGTFSAGFDSGWAAMRWVLSSFAVFFGFLVPFLPVLALLGLAIWGWLRHRAKHPKPPRAQPVATGAWDDWVMPPQNPQASSPHQVQGQAPSSPQSATPTEASEAEVPAPHPGPVPPPSGPRQTD